MSLETPGPLTRVVLDYDQTMRRLVPAVKTPDDWAPLAELVDVDEFERVGCFLEVQNWPQYTEMLAKWASAIATFETTVRRITEVPGLVYYEVEERHFRGGNAYSCRSARRYRLRRSVSSESDAGAVCERLDLVFGR